MRIALGIVSLSEQGGLQRDCLGLADALRARGHEVEVFAARFAPPWSGAHRAEILSVRSLTNHGRDVAFARALGDRVRSRFDLVVGFNKMPGLDVYYCGDPCVAAKSVRWWRRVSLRRRAQLVLEGACFGASSATSTLMLSPAALAFYREAWGTPAARMLLLPPRIAADRARPAPADPALRRERRSALGYADNDLVWLWVATQPATKGLDRILSALTRHPDARLVVVGPSPLARKTRPYLRLAERLKASLSVQWLGPRQDIPELMAVADILVHPARLEVAGLVILEALANGLPVVASGVCGFAHHVQAAGAGIVTPEPFGEAAFDRALNLASDAAIRERWSAAARAYCREHDFARGHEAAAEVIERIGHQKLERS
jgi:UDP-glucose:(heptosyl)LPS alpha-1,3-glucosyltransferase